MGFTKNILVIHSGKLTRGQKEKAKDEMCIRADKVTTALEWSRDNNWEWQNKDLNELRKSTQDASATVVDNSEECDSEDSNVEKEEAFTAHCPGGATTPQDGGFDEPGAFEAHVQQMQSQGFDVEFQMNLSNDFVRGDDGGAHLNSSVPQFPHGLGGLDESRINLMIGSLRM